MAYSRGFLAYMHALINGENEMRFILLLLTVFAVSTVNAQEKIDADVSTYTNLLKQLDQHPALEAVRQQVIEQREAAAGAASSATPRVAIYAICRQLYFERLAPAQKAQAQHLYKCRAFCEHF